MDWHKKVYRKKLTFDQLAWNEQRKKAMKRDGYKCIWCKRRAYGTRYLTVHHIMPRSMEGTDDLDNLLTLCGECHDRVELAGCITLDEIKLCLINEEIQGENVGETIKIDDGEINYNDWHVWVYGAGRKKEG